MIAMRERSRWARAVLGLSVLALWSAGCTPYLGTTAASFLRHAQTNPDPNLRYLAIGKLGSPEVYDNEVQKEDAIKFLMSRYQSGRDPLAVRAMMVRSLGNLRATAARELVRRAAMDSEAMLRLEGCRALGKVGAEDDATMLARIMIADPLEDVRVAAIESLGTLKPKDPRILSVLLMGMEHEDPAIRYESVKALRAITGEDHGVLLADWKKALAPKLAETAVPAPAQKPVQAQPKQNRGPLASIADAALKRRQDEARSKPGIDPVIPNE